MLPMAMDRTTAEPSGSAGTIHSLVAALTVYDVYKGLIPIRGTMATRRKTATHGTLSLTPRVSAMLESKHVAGYGLYLTRLAISRRTLL